MLSLESAAREPMVPKYPPGGPHKRRSSSSFHSVTVVQEEAMEFSTAT